MSKRGEALKIETGFLLLVVVVGGFLWWMNSNQSPQAAAPAATTQVQPSTTSTQPTRLCAQQTDGTNNFDVAVRNLQSTGSLKYVSAPISVNVRGDGSTTLATGTSSDSATLSYTSIAVTPCKDATVYILGNASTSSTSKDTDSYEMNRQLEMTGAAASTLKMSFNDVSYNNATKESDAQVGGTITFKNTSFASGGSLTFVLDIEVSNASSTFGYVNGDGSPADDGIIISCDLPTSKFSAAGGIVFSTTPVPTTKITCPSDVSSNRQADACWQVRTLRTQDGLLRFVGTLKADTGDPASTDQPKCYMDDTNFYRDLDGTIKKARFDSGGTNVGVAGSTFQWDVN